MSELVALGNGTPTESGLHVSSGIEVLPFQYRAELREFVTERLSEQNASVDVGALLGAALDRWAARP